MQILIVSMVKYLNRRGELLFAQSGRMQCAPTSGFAYLIAEAIKPGNSMGFARTKNEATI
jgi:hypothetical protein